YSDANLLLPAAIGGLGVALVRASLVEAELASGRLVRLFSRSVRTRYSSFIVYPPRSKSFGKVQVFQQWLLEQARPVERKDAVIAAADAGSFSAGARQLRRAQSVVSQTLANLEAQVGVKLFDRSRRAPVLTREGVALLAEARAVVGGMDVFKARAKGLSDGLEPELCAVVDV